MCLRLNRHFIAFLFAYLALISFKAQTLYWIGGSGNFNDPAHWSSASGGVTANHVPTGSTNVIFDDNSSAVDFSVNFTGQQNTSSFKAQTVNRKITFTGASSSQLQVSGNFFLNARSIPEFKTALVFKAAANATNTADFSKQYLSSEIEFTEGNWNVKNLISRENTVTFLAGKIYLDYTRIEVGSFIANTGTTSFKGNQSLVRVLDKFLLSSNTTFETNNVTFDLKYKDAQHYQAGTGFTNAPSSKIIGGGNTINVCGIILTSFPVTCFGNSDGMLVLSVDPTCAVGVYTLTWNNPGPIGTLCADVFPVVQTITVTASVNTFSFPGMPACPFTYDAQMVDGSNTFYYSNSINIPGPGAINLSAQTIVNPSCFGLCNGTYVANLNNGTPPYNIILTPPIGPIQTFTNQSAGTKTFSSLCGGVQSFSITDANGCSRTFTLMINQPATLTANPITTSITCNTFSNGALSVSPLGGSPNYTVNFSIGATQVTGTLGTVNSTGLSPGPISATVTDSKGCTAFVNSTINQPSAFSVTQFTTHVLCNGASTGSASVLVSGGTPSYAFSWAPSPGTSSAITGLSAGTQTVTITDVNSCTTSASFSISQPPAITLTPASTNVVCSGSCTGTAAVAASGGNGSFTFTWVAPGPSTISVGTASSVTNLCSGNYTVFIRDGNLCAPAPLVINISQPPLVTLTAMSQSISCFGANNGSATVTATGGNGAPYTYSWTPGAMTTSVITGLGPNVYNVVVRDASLCPTSTNVTIIEPAGLFPTVTFTNLTCNSANAPCDGRINTSPIGGVAPYQYTLTSATSTIVTAAASSTLFTGLCAGVYTVIVRDASSCPQQSIVTLTQPGAIVPSISTTSVICFGGNTGGLTGSPGSGGTPTYALTWMTPSGPASGASLSNQLAGSYTLFVTDSRTCMAQATATVTQPSSITIAVSTSSISCFSICNGALTSTVTGGTPGYNYAWTNSLNVSVGTTSVASSLCPGVYTVTITDANLCTRTTTGAVLSPSPLVLTQTATPVNCFGDSNGSATVTAVGGTTPYVNYIFVSPTSTIINTTGIISSQPSGTFIVTVTDNAGCTQTISTAINSPTALAAVISGTGSCNVCNGTATITPSFGTAPYSYLWTSLSGTFATTPTVAALCTGNYTATVTDSKGCSITRTISISQIISISINPGAASILCNGALTGSATTTPSGGIAGYTYSWTPSSQTTSVISGVGAGSYTVRVTDSSTPACSHTAAITLTQPPAITVTATQTNVTCFGFTNGVISSTVTGGTAGYTYSWSPGSQTTPAISSLSSGSYTLRVRDANLCLATQNFSVTQSPSITITFTAGNPSGCAVPNGSICTTASGGSGSGYTYTWAPVSGTNNCLSGLNGGTYQHTVTDGAGCTNSISVTLFNATGPTLTAVSRSVDCFGASTGAATVTAAGVAPFTFTWSPAVTSAPITNGTIGTGLSNGVYVVTCSDFNGCVTNTSIPINQGSSVTINSIVTPARCNSLCNGSIVVAPTQGTLTSPSFTFSWLPVTPIITGQGTRTVTNLCSNPYTLNLTDANNCATQYTFSITQPTAIAITAVTSSLLCNNACTGSIVANATGGTGSLNYSWTPVGGNTQTVTNLCATGGTNATSYTLTITDAQSCTATATYTIVQPALLTNTVNVINATCSNSCNAVASQTAGGGVGGYNYSWSSSSVTTSSLGAHCAGTYTALATDANGCLSSRVYTVGPPAPLNLTLTPSNPLCNAACNGSVTTLVSGAQGTVSYAWLPAGSGQSPMGLCATPNPVYTVVATDQNSCSVTSVVTLTNPPSMLATVSGTNPTCHNFTNGIASVSVSNAIGATTYTWVLTGPPAQTTQIAAGLASGPHTVLVRDANNCQASQTFTLINPPALLVNTSLNPASCSQSNGAITANPSGGTPGSPVPYTYTWTGVVSSASAVTGVAAGPYTVSVSDGLGCTTTVNILLNNSNGPSTMPVISSSLLCNAQCAGTASVDISNISGGTSPYTASWIAPAPSTVNPLSNLCAGSYTARVVDATGCIGFTAVTIAEPPPIVNAPTIGLPLCPGICSGSITLNTTGGNAPYTFSWIPVSSSSSVLTNLCAGDYTLIVGYNTVCADTSVINLPDQSSITIVPTLTNNICFGSCNGIVNLSVSGGSSPYTAGWNTSQTGMNLNNLCNGNYTVVVSDNNGCSNTATAAITSNAQLTTTTAIFSPSCGACDGTASVTVSSGTGPFTYTWSNSAATPSISNLCAGIYQVIVADALSCSQSHTVIINNSNGITGENITIQDIPCSGACVGAATVSAIGGNAPVTYTWVNASPVVTGSVVTNLCPGIYFVQMSDAAGCIRSASATIDPLVTLTVSPFVHLPACGTTDGSISIVIAGGTPSYNIVWNPPAGITTSLTNLTSGVYSYTVTESGTHSCSISNTINISNSDGPVIAATQRNIDCFGSCTGSISSNVTSTNVPLTYAWSTGSTTAVVNNLCKGVVTFTVTDFVGCKAFQSFTITDNPQLQLGLSNIQNPSCLGDCDGIINLLPNGGVLPYTYTWTVANATTNPITSLCDGTYTANVIDALGCIVSSPSFTIKSASSVSLVINTSSSSCSSVADATISVIPSGGITEYLYAWQGPSGYTASTQNISNVFSGTYTVNVIDNLGCSKDSVLSISPSITVVANAGPDGIICPETGSIVLNATGSSTNTNYKWFSLTDSVNAISNGPLLMVSHITEPTSFILKSISAVPACFDRDTINIDLHSLPAVDAGRDFLVPVHSTVTLGGYPSTWSPVTLTWSPAAYLNDAGSSNPIATNTVDVTFTLSVTDGNGCIASDSVHVFLFPELKISSGFTPNEDGKNDLWIIDYIDQFPSTTVEIFNRWGDIIFSSSGYGTPFDGKYKGTDLPVGTYYYIIKLNHPGYPKPITGPLTIFR